MITVETTFKEMRRQRLISLSTLNGANRMGWQDLKEMMHATGTLSALFDVPFRRGLVYAELAMVLDMLTELDRSLVNYLEIPMEAVEGFEALYSQMASRDKAGGELWQRFAGAWELRTIAAYYPEVLEERLSSYPPLQRRKFLEWAITFFQEVKASGLAFKGRNHWLLGMDEVITRIEQALLRYYFCRHQDPFPKWDFFLRNEFKWLAEDLRIPRLTEAIRKDPSLLGRLLSVAYLPQEEFISRVVGLISGRSAKDVYTNLIPELVKVMTGLEKATQADRLIREAEFILDMPILDDTRVELAEVIRRTGRLPMFYLARHLLERSGFDILSPLKG